MAVKASTLGAKTVNGPRPLRWISSVWNQRCNFSESVWTSRRRLLSSQWNSHHSPSERWRSLSASWSGAPADSQRSVWSPLVTCILMRGWSLSCSPSPRCLCRWCRLRWSYCYTCRYEHLDPSCYTWRDRDSRRSSGDVTETETSTSQNHGEIFNFHLQNHDLDFLCSCKRLLNPFTSCLSTFASIHNSFIWHAVL